jgi:hypothetical protein
MQHPVPYASGSYNLSLASQYANGYMTTSAANSTGGHTFISPSDDGGIGVETMSLDTAEGFRIFGLSENATTNTLAIAAGKSADLITMHYNGRRWANSELFTSIGSGSGYGDDHNSDAVATPHDLSNDRLSYEAALDTDTTFSFGYHLNGKYTNYGSRNNWFDGDMAEIVWFNEQLSNTQIALVEGYLAHKYGIADDLIHKDGSGDHPYKYQAPPAVGANNTSY